MIKNRDRIIDYFYEIESGTVVVANDLYESNFTKMSQDAFFRAMERLADEKIIIRIGKGLYIKRTDSDLNRQELLLNYFFGENNSKGMFTGYRLFNKYNITQHESDLIELFSVVIRTDMCNIENIKVRRPQIDLSFENTRVIECLEILENYDDIEELDKLKFAKYAKAYSRGYDDSAAVRVINSMKYKKRTIAFMKKILDMYKVPNTLQQFLSYASDYRVPPVQRVLR